MNKISIFDLKPGDFFRFSETSRVVSYMFVDSYKNNDFAMMSDELRPTINIRYVTTHGEVYDVSWFGYVFKL